MIIDIVISVYNKEKDLLNFFNKIEEELKGIKHRFIFVDDASTDKSLEVLKSIQKKNENLVKIISLSKTYGKDASIYAGINNTKHDLICIYDLELQASISYISKMYDILKNNNEYDQVCMLANYKETNFNKKAKIKLLNSIFDINIDNNKTYYRMFRRNVLNAIIQNTNDNLFTNYSFELLGFNTHYIKFDNSHIDNDNLNKYINYSKKPYNFLRIINLILIILLFIYFVLTVLEIVNINNNVLFIFILILLVINTTITYVICNIANKEKTHYSIKEKIGFDDKVL